MGNYVKVYWFWIIILFILCSLIYLVKDIIFPFILGGTLAYVAAPFVGILSKRVNRSAVSFMIAVFLLGMLLSLIYNFIPFWNNEIKCLVKNLPTYIAAFNNYVGTKADDLKYWGIDVAVVKSDLQSYVINNINLLVSCLLKLISKTEALTGFFSALFVVPLTMFYVLKDWEKINNNIIKLIPLRSRDSVKDLQLRIRTCFSKFLIGQLFVAVILGSYYVPCLTFLGIDGSIFWGVISGFASFIPFLGAIFCCMVVAFIGAFSGFSIIKILVTVVIYLIGQFFEGYILSPKFVGNEVNIHPLLLLFAFFVGMNLGGVVGVFICIPCIAILSEVLRFFLDKFRETNFFKQN